MKVVALKKEMMELFEFRDEERDYYLADGSIDAAIEAMTQFGECFAAVKDGRILVIGGVQRQTQKTAVCFTIFSKYADLYPRQVARLTRRFFEQTIETMELHRLVTYNKPEFVAHHRWCEWLGFKREGLVRKLDDEGNDYIQFAWVL